MNRGHGTRSPMAFDPLTMLLHQAELIAEHGARGGGTEANDDLRVNEGELRFQPWAAGCDLDRRGRFVNATFFDALELEMLYRIRNVQLIAPQLDLGERAIEDLS